MIHRKVFYRSVYSYMSYIAGLKSVKKFFGSISGIFKSRYFSLCKNSYIFFPSAVKYIVAEYCKDNSIRYTTD